VHRIKIRNVNQHVFTLLKNEFLLVPKLREEYSDLSGDYHEFINGAFEVLKNLKSIIESIPAADRTWKKPEKKRK